MNNIKLKIANRLGILPYLQLKGDLLIEGKGIKIPVKGGLGFGLIRIAEPWMTGVLKKLKPLFSGHFVDVGVNIGQTLVKVKAVFNEVQYTGFEPNPSCVQYVEELIRINKFSGCHIIPAGIGNTNDLLKLHFFASDESDQSASLLENFRPKESIDHIQYVPVFSDTVIHQFLPKYQNAILKIDVEGAELEVLTGIEKWIQEFNPFILIEILPVYDESNDFRLQRQTALESFLMRNGYVIYRIAKDAAVTLVQIDTIGIHGNLEDCDYLLCPKQHISPIRKLFNS